MNPDESVLLEGDQAFYATHIAKPHLHKLWLLVDDDIYERTFMSGPMMAERIANG